MPHEQMNEQQVAAYLHLDAREVHKLASRGKIPCRKSGGKFVFRKIDMDHWIEQQMSDLGRDRLRGIERGVGAHHGLDVSQLMVWPMIPDGGIAVPLKAKTRDAALRSLVDLAFRAELVYDRDRLIEEVRAREDLCSTAMAPGVALPHPRHPLPYDIAASFVIVGLTSSGIPFGAVDGTLTRLFFLICCKDDRTHLHVLARLAQMLHDQAYIDEMVVAGDADELATIVRNREELVVAREG
ncbi:MAG: PTS sugar transporter subunit IIA [Phycisphaerae bacterium]|jgi:PTS system nitrogen regulatory IIA component